MKITSLQLAALPFLFIFLCGCYNKQPSVRTGKEGKDIPSFDVLKTDNTTYFNTANTPNRNPIVLFSLSTHCPYCKAQMEEIINDMDKLKDIQFYIFFSSSPISELNKFQTQYQLSKYANIRVSMDYNKIFSKYFEITTVPFLAVYGKDKKLKVAFLGKTDIDQIKKAAFKS